MVVKKNKKNNILFTLTRSMRTRQESVHKEFNIEYFSGRQSSRPIIKDRNGFYREGGIETVFLPTHYST